jgi:TIR domain
MGVKIFISYRRNDGAAAGRVHDCLASEFGSDLVFMDIDTIPLGANFIKVLRDAVSKCDVLLAVIGPNWLDVKNEHGRRKLDDLNDPVRIEITMALKRDIPVIPILLEGVKIPNAERLPEDMQELSLRNGLEVRHTSFHGDMDKLILGVKHQLSTLADEGSVESCYEGRTNNVLNTNRKSRFLFPRLYLAIAAIIGIITVYIVQPTNLGGDFVLFSVTFVICAIIGKVSELAVQKVVSKK